MGAVVCANPYCRDGWVERSDNESGGAPAMPCGACAERAAASNDITRWFSFGFDHRHNIDGRVFDQNTIAKVTAPDPRAVMLAVFGQEWSFEYAEPPSHPLMRDLPILDVSLVVSDGG